LTSLHLLFVRNVLKAEIYEAALPIIDKPIHSFPSQTSHRFDGETVYSDHQDSSAYITIASGLTRKLDEKQIQEYYLLCAMICMGIGRRKYEDALMYLEMVLITPASNAASIFMLEAYRKWVLLYCLTKGRDPPHTPKAINSAAMRMIHNVAKPYDALAVAFGKSIQTNNRSFIQDEVEAGLQIWDSVSNFNNHLYCMLTL
jgi:COP9 signalosome complex subunit 3